MPLRRFMRVTLSLPEARALLKRANEGVQFNAGSWRGGGYSTNRPALSAIDKLRRGIRRAE